MENTPSQIINNVQDLKAVLDIFPQVETIEGNKVNSQGSISVPQKYAGQRPLIAIIPNNEVEQQ